MGHTVSIVGDGNTVVQIEGDNNIVQLGRAHLVLTRFEALRGLDNPLNQLTPYARSTPLLGRDVEMASLRSFLQDARPISVRVMVGSGGSGKTRLALDLCDSLAQEGWNTGFATGAELDRFVAQQNLSTWRWQKPTLVVIDYAAAKAETLKTWLSELADRSQPAPYPSHPLRLLLLERHADPQGGWWQTVFGGDARQYARQALLDPPVPVEIRRLVAQQDRLALLRNMLDQQAIWLPLDGPVLQAELMAAPWGGDPLFLMMAALHMARLGHAQALSLGRTDLAMAVAGWEVQRLQKMAQAQHLDPAWVLHLAACATLAQGLEHKAFIAFAVSEKAVSGWEGAPPAVAKLLEQALPQPGGIAPVTPDLIGEALVLQVLRDDPDAVQRCYAALGQKVAEAAVRCAQDFAAESPLPLQWLNAMVDAAQQDVPALVQLLFSLPMGSVVLGDVSLRVAQCLQAQCAADPAANLGLQAAALLSLSLAQSQVGQPEAALLAAQQAEALYRRLAEQQPDVFTADLGRALNNLAFMHSNLAQAKAAVLAGLQAVALYAGLVAQQPEAFTPDWAVAQLNLAKAQIELGQLGEALHTVNQSIILYRGLVEQQPDVYSMNLARSLNNLAYIHSQQGQSQAALQSALEAVELYRTLAAQRPDLFTSELAFSLFNLTKSQVELGQFQMALPVAQEALDLHQQLARQRPEVFLSLLARSQTNLSYIHSALGQHAEALQSAQQAVDAYHQLALQRPEVFQPDLAIALLNLTKSQVESGEPAAALQSAQEAADLYRSLARRAPDVYTPELGKALSNLAGMQLANGLVDAAVETAQQATVLHQGLEVARPGVFSADWARALFILSRAHATQEQFGAARQAAQQSVDLYRPLAVQLPDLYGPDLARSLYLLAVCIHRQAGEDASSAPAVAQSAVQVLLPHFLQRAEAYVALMQPLLSDYFALCQAAGQEPDQALLAPLQPFFAQTDEDAPP
ncbi:MAG: tetratricopeptide repeat protein [Burkholderiales bacterium]|nr:tetratricopeptide repeat protein [Burkholderiales bacterium]